MKKLSKILVLVLALAMLTAVFAMTASAVSSTQSWVVAGSSALCNGENWAATSSKNKMTWDADNSRFYKEYTNVAAGTYEFKCVLGGSSWYPGSNVKITVATTGSTVKIYVSGSNKVTYEIIEPSCPSHDPKLAKTTATCLTAGVETWSCEACGEGFTKDVYAYGHYYDANGKCIRCDETTEIVRVYVDNAAKWADVYCYVWDTNPYVSWPGEKMNYDAESGLYYYDVPKHFVNIIFSNAGSPQSADMKTPTTTATIYNNSTKKWTAPHVCSFSDATCTKLATCSCGKTQGELAPHNMVAGEVVAPTYTAGGYTVYTCSGCGATENRDVTDKLVPAFPEATVTPIEGTDLTFALNFGIKGVSIVDGEIVLDPEVLTEEYIAAVLETYGKMYVDYRLTISGLNDPSVTLNSDGTADGYLGGQYDAWSENWVYVPFGDSVVIENGKSLMIMEYAAQMMGQTGLRQILEEIITVVVDFDCGVYFTPEFLAHNPDMVVTLELLVFNEDENGELTDVITVAENVFTAHTHSWSAPTCTEPAKCECGETQGEALGHTYYYNLCLVCYAANPYFENNFTTVGENKLVCNEYHLVDTDTHKCPYQFTLVTIPEDGLYIFTADATKLGVFIYTIEINTEGADFSVGGASWAAVTFGQAELKAGQYYLGFVFYQGVGEYDLTITKHEHEFVEGSCACGAEDPNWVAPHEHNFVEGKCECGETDPDYVEPVEPQEPQEEPNFFQKILAWIVELFKQFIALFKKN